jgi:hypothetical protein
MDSDRSDVPTSPSSLSRPRSGGQWWLRRPRKRTQEHAFHLVTTIRLFLLPEYPKAQVFIDQTKEPPKMIKGHATKKETIRHPLSDMATRSTPVTDRYDQQKRQTNNSPIRLPLWPGMGLLDRSRWSLGNTLDPVLVVDF